MGDLPVEEGRPEQYPGDDLAEYLRLADALRGRPEDAGEQDDDREVHYQQLDVEISHRVNPPG